MILIAKNKLSSFVQLQIFSKFYKNPNKTVEGLIIPNIICNFPQFRVDSSILSEFQQMLTA